MYILDISMKVTHVTYSAIILAFLVLVDSAGSHNTFGAVLGLRSSRFANSSCMGVNNMDQRMRFAQSKIAQMYSKVDMR